jgi:hypothetical protein
LFSVVTFLRSCERAHVGLDPIDEFVDALRALASERREVVLNVRRHDRKAPSLDQAIAL